MGNGKQPSARQSNWDRLMRRGFRLSALLDIPYLRLQIAFICAALVLIFGTLGYMWVEHYRPLDALFMTVITLSTVGYGTIRELDDVGKVFTIGLIIVGVLVATWLLSTIVEVVSSSSAMLARERRYMEKLITATSGHFLVCGYGRIGRQIIQEYTRNQVPFVLIDLDPNRIEAVAAQSLPYVAGDASDEAVLKRAGIDRAAGLIAVTPTDAVNTFIVLTARGIRSDLFIVARADSPQNVQKIYRAGASKVVSPHALGGRWMGITAVNPAVTDFIMAMTDMHHHTAQIREIAVANTSIVLGKTLKELRARIYPGAMLLAIRDIDGHYLPNPPDEHVLVVDDTMIAMGEPEQLRNLARAVDPSRPLPPLMVG